MEANVRPMPRKVGPQQAVEGFTCGARQTKSNHAFQLFVDCGGDPGPWVALGINDTVYTLGWVPEKYLEKL